MSLPGRTTLFAGAAAGVTSVLALAVVARLEGKGVFQPLNATSHWLNGEPAARLDGSDLMHTAVGFATHQAATFFWAAVLERWTAASRTTGPLGLAGFALATSAIAAAVDYGATPKRFTPGWEFVLSKRSMAAVYAAMAAGLFGGALAAAMPPPLQRCRT